MNVNPHLYNSSPQVTQMQLLQRQQLLQEQGTPLSQQQHLTNGTGLSANPVLQQLQLQQMQQQQQHQQQPIPIIKEVWSHNLEYEFNNLRKFINDKSAIIYAAIHQETPGIVARAIGSFKTSTDYHFQTIRCNSDLLNLIQFSICFSKGGGNPVIWQFNFAYDLSREMYSEEHLAMLAQQSSVNFQAHMSRGIKHFEFAELLIDSGLLLDKSINWVSYHAGYDLGFLISMLMNDSLPVDEEEFHWWCDKYFPNFFDLKYIGNQVLGSDEKMNKPSIEYLAEELHLLPISPSIRQLFGNAAQHPTSTLHAYLSMECFKELMRQSVDPTRFKGYIWGLAKE